MAAIGSPPRLFGNTETRMATGNNCRLGEHRASAHPIWTAVCSGSQACVLAVIAGCGGGDGQSESASPPTPDPWQTPNCVTVTGTAVLTFTSDDGATRTPRQSSIEPNQFVFGLATLTAPNTLLAIAKTTSPNIEILFSTNAGCSWRNTGQTVPDQLRATAAGGTAYAWQFGRTFIYRLSETGVPTRIDIPFSFTGLGVDPRNPDRIRSAHALPSGLQLMESLDGGRNWMATGVVVSDEFRQDLVFFSPTNLDHVIALSGGIGARVTLDGGNQWIISQGFIARGRANGRTAAIGADGQTVWLLLQDSVFDPTQTAEPKSIYLSRDGGINFQRVFTETDVPLSSGGTRLYPHPSDPNVLYIAPGVFSGLSRYDAALSRLTTKTWPSIEGTISAIAFNPVDARYLYLGLSRSEPTSAQGK